MPMDMSCLGCGRSDGGHSSDCPSVGKRRSEPRAEPVATDEAMRQFELGVDPSLALADETRRKKPDRVLSLPVGIGSPKEDVEELHYFYPAGLLTKQEREELDRVVGAKIAEAKSRRPVLRSFMMNDVPRDLIERGDLLLVNEVARGRGRDAVSVVGVPKPPGIVFDFHSATWVPDFSSTLPTKSGWYWWRSDKTERPSVRAVSVINGIPCTGQYQNQSVEEVGGEWAGPLAGPP